MPQPFYFGDGCGMVTLRDVHLPPALANARVDTLTPYFHTKIQEVITANLLNLDACRGKTVSFFNSAKTQTCFWCVTGRETAVNFTEGQSRWGDGDGTVRKTPASV